MKNEGPPLTELLRHLVELPADFHRPPLLGGKGEIQVTAVVGDLLVTLGEEPLGDLEWDYFQGKHSDSRSNHLQLVLYGCWLFYHPFFKTRPRPGAIILPFFIQDCEKLAGVLQARKWLEDPDRREELVRRSLQIFDSRPGGESLKLAQDRLAALDSLERARLVRETEEARKRAEKVRQQLAKKEAEEAAAKVSRE